MANFEQDDARAIPAVVHLSSPVPSGKTPPRCIGNLMKTHMRITTDRSALAITRTLRETTEGSKSIELEPLQVVHGG